MKSLNLKSLCVTIFLLLSVIDARPKDVPLSNRVDWWVDAQGFSDKYGPIYCPFHAPSLVEDHRTARSADIKRIMPLVAICALDPTLWNNMNRRDQEQDFSLFIMDAENLYGQHAGVEAALFINDVLRPLFDGIREQRKAGKFDYGKAAIIIENAIRYTETKSYGPFYAPALKSMHRHYVYEAGK